MNAFPASNTNIVFNILRFVHTIISRNSKTKSNGLPTLEHHPPGYVEKHLPESQRLDPTLPEKYNNLVTKQVEKLYKAVVQISQV
jgi:hypothetical protein